MFERHGDRIPRLRALDKDRAGHRIHAGGVPREKLLERRLRTHLPGRGINRLDLDRFARRHGQDWLDGVVPAEMVVVPMDRVIAEHACLLVGPSEQICGQMRLRAAQMRGNLKGKDRQVWRRRGDSNPRYGFRPYNGLANRRLQPLGHVSAGRKGLLVSLGAVNTLRVRFPATRLLLCQVRPSPAATACPCCSSAQYARLGPRNPGRT